MDRIPMVEVFDYKQVDIIPFWLSKKAPDKEIGL